jgi:hypothetical protein
MTISGHIGQPEGIRSPRLGLAHSKAHGYRSDIRAFGGPGAGVGKID